MLMLLLKVILTFICYRMIILYPHNTCYSYNSCIFNFFLLSYIVASGTAQQVSPCPERSTREATKISSEHKTISQEQLDLPERAELLTASHSTTPIIAIQTMPMKFGSHNSNKGSSSHDPELCLAMGWVVFWLHS